MRIIIVGGLGFIGQNLARHLRHVDESFELIAIDWFEDATDTERSLFDDVHTVCFADDTVMPLYTSADVIIHLAAYTTVQESIVSPLRSFDNNVIKTLKILEFLRLNSPNTKIIFASTGGAIIGDYEGPINEKIAANPLSPYGASKLAVEGLLSAYRGSYGLNSASIRFSNVYGPYSSRKGSVIAAFCKMYIEDSRLKINGDGMQTRDYIYVDDVSDAIVRVIRQDGQGVFQLGTGIGTSILEIADIFRTLDPKRKISLQHVEALSGEVRHNKADIRRIRDELGFQPRFSVEKGIQKTMEWFEDQYV